MVTTRPKKTVSGQSPKTDIFLRIQELRNEKKQRAKANRTTLRTTATTHLTVPTEQNSNQNITTTKTASQTHSPVPFIHREDTLTEAVNPASSGTILTLEEFSSYYCKNHHARPKAIKAHLETYMATTGNTVPSGGASVEVWEDMLQHSRNRNASRRTTDAQHTAGSLAQQLNPTSITKEDHTQNLPVPEPTREDILNEAYLLAARSSSLLTLDEFAKLHPGRPKTIKTRIEEHMSNTGELFPSGTASWADWYKLLYAGGFRTIKGPRKPYPKDTLVTLAQYSSGDSERFSLMWEYLLRTATTPLDATAVASIDHWDTVLLNATSQQNTLGDRTQSIAQLTRTSAAESDGEPISLIQYNAKNTVQYMFMWRHLRKSWDLDTMSKLSSPARSGTTLSSRLKLVWLAATTSTVSTQDLHPAFATSNWLPWPIMNSPRSRPNRDHVDVRRRCLH